MFHLYFIGRPSRVILEEIQNYKSFLLYSEQNPNKDVHRGFEIFILDNLVA